MFHQTTLVLNAALFDFEKNPNLTVIIAATGVTNTATVAINLVNLCYK